MGREELAGVLILIDVRRGPEQEEHELAAFLEHHGIAHAWVGTKADKLKSTKLRQAVSVLREALAPSQLMVTSSERGSGIDEIWRWIRAAVADELPASGGTGEGSAHGASGPEEG